VRRGRDLAQAALSTIRLFGRSLYFDNTIEIIAKRTGAAVVGAFLDRGADGRYVMRIEDVSVERTPASVARECLSLWEKYVTRSPSSGTSGSTGTR